MSLKLTRPLKRTSLSLTQKSYPPRSRDSAGDNSFELTINSYVLADVLILNSFDLRSELSETVIFYGRKCFLPANIAEKGAEYFYRGAE